MKNTIASTLYLILAFCALVYGVYLMLVHYVTSISNTAPDALHFIGFVALMPMIGVVGGERADRKLAYIKHDRVFKPFVAATFLITYGSLLPWIFTFFVDHNNLFIYIDWAIVLVSIGLSFALFSMFLAIFIKK